ncbi:MAG TPA: hypothetical protein VMW54_11645 [Terriglobia bacterium]|nr:hypothetical protein [Terriglobia bacterium]
MRLRVQPTQEGKPCQTPAAGFASPWAVFVLSMAFLAGSGTLLSAAAQSPVPATATPQITKVQPSEAAPGSRLILKIDGEQFAEGAYVSFSDPSIHVVSTRRLSGTEMEADVAIGGKAQPNSVRLYVANPSGTVGQFAFAITSGTTPGAQPPSAASSAPPAASTPNAPTAAGPVASGPAAPQVSAIDPDHAAPGSKASIKVTGKRFAKGVKVVFQNPGIHVLSTEFKKSTELVAQIEVASDAPTGKTGLFVVNPDESEVEAGFAVTAGTSSQSQGNSQTAAGGASASAVSKSYKVIDLGDAIGFLRNPNMPKGVLTLVGGKLTYQEKGKDVFTAGPGDVKEVAPNIIFGINTDTFHIILKSGKTYNFVSASLMPADTASIITTLQQAFH